MRLIRLLFASLLAACTLPAAEVMHDGSRVHYESHGKGADALVFVHGWSCDLTFWSGQAPVYKIRRTLLIDLPGHGRSDKPDVAYTPDRFARAIEAVMREAGVERGVLVGHSMGGPVVLTFLRLFPAKTKALVLVDSYIPPVPKDDAERAKQKALLDSFAPSLRDANYKAAAQKMIETMFTEKTPSARRDEILARMLATPQHVMVSALQSAFSVEAPKPGETYAIPAMVIMVARRQAGEYQVRLRTLFPNLKYEEWEGAGHFLMIDSAEHFNRALEEFLKNVDRRGK
jgi:pimeloyl-ACP methyl ester carboxylesterase